MKIRVCSLWVILLFLFHACYVSADNIRGIFVAPYAVSSRYFNKLIFYSKWAGINAFVLHVKDPRGLIYWNTKNPTAKKINALSPTNLGWMIKTLKENNIRPIAKLDVFADNLLASSRPEFAAIDSLTGAPWKDHLGLSWVDPYNFQVWAYNISLAQELADIGFQEVQFDYIRFPSDGKLSTILYPSKPDTWKKPDALSGFLAWVSPLLKSKNVTVSADVFGLTIFKKDDFGVGQVLERLATHCDVVCPMIYPSHFPSGFKGLKTPSDHPNKIIRMSAAKMRKNPEISFRPWIQGFWYEPSEIAEQLKGIGNFENKGWSVWNPSTNYSTFFKAVAHIKSVSLPQYNPYPLLEELEKKPFKIVKGINRIVHFTNYTGGYSVITLEKPGGNGNAISTSAKLMTLFDEAILDEILLKRGIDISENTAKRRKEFSVTKLLLKDLGLNHKRIKPRLIYVNWTKSAKFSFAIPDGARNAYISEENHNKKT